MTPTTLLFVLTLSYILLRWVKKSRPPYPPGPSPKPIIGNVFDIPLKKPWLKYLEWSKTFNSVIIHLTAMNNLKHIVVLNKIEDVLELLERRSGNYSSRQSSPIAKVLGIEGYTVFLPYGSALRKHRKYLEENFSKDVVRTYQHVLAKKVHLLLNQFLQDPARFDEHCQTLASSVMLAMVLGYDIVPGGEKNRFLEKGEFAVASTVEILLPGRTLITVLPFLRHIPTWFPGASTQRFCAQIREAFVQYRIGSFEFVKKNMAAGTAKDSIAKRLVERVETDDVSLEDEKLLMDAVSNLHLAGIETTHILLTTFVLTMTLHPVEQKKAQQEIDHVVGSDRLPNFEDRSSLPYVEALYREVLRWRPIGPLSFPHATDKDDVYNGYFIPKGANVFANVWAISRNEIVYPDPEAFQPERFFKNDGTLKDDNVTYLFGFGRRICPGRHLADSVIWLTIASVLAMFNISKAKDADGNIVEVDAGTDAFTDSILSGPLPFECSITPRSSLAQTIIRHAADVVLQDLKGQ